MGLLTYIEKNIFSGKNSGGDEKKEGNSGGREEGSPEGWDNWRPMLSVVSPAPAPPHSFYCSFHISLSKAFGDNFFITCFFFTETFMMCVNVFYITRNKISADSDKR